jgi:hypothetical protein
VNALQEHWTVSEVEATKVGPAKSEVTTKGVTDFTLNLPAALGLGKESPLSGSMARPSRE